MPPETVRKRDGRTEVYDRTRIVRAVELAARAAGVPLERGGELAGRVAGRVEEALAGRGSPSVEGIQDAVESALIALGASEVAKSYILYRSRRTDSRRAAGALGVRDDLKLGADVLRILEARYLRRDADGRVCESPKEMFRRVASTVARAELAWSGESEAARVEEEFFRALSAREFLPNSPALMNAGTPIGQLAACFVLPVEDSIDGIFRTLGAMAKIHQSGGGTGFSFSRLRPKDDIVASTGGVASGPVSFMRIYDETTDVIKQGGRRRGANMGVLRADHPDIMEFIRAKSEGDILRNFNLSVAATDEFLDAAARGAEYDLVSPRTGETVRRANATAVLDMIAAGAWASGEPGMLFADALERANPTPELGRIEATNPCGEQPLLPYEACVLGSVNLVACLRRSNNGKRKAELDRDKLARLVRLGVRFLDDCLEVSRWPLDEIARATQANRKVGLGVMGFADLLFELGVAYDSDEALALGEKTMAFVTEHAHAASRELAAERGAFPNFERSVRRAGEPMRNAAVTTVAPTGTLSLIAGTSSGIEPRFALVSLRVLLAGSRMLETVPAFERTIAERGLANESLMSEVARRGSVRGLDSVPEDVRRVFATALDISPEWHVRMQAAFQRHTDSAVSKTVNLPPGATPADV
ncbi:MAG: adenosylcobalamin-dependent ribonucleoside-diphosphate reductase, partial [Planctomycetota bacterium]